MTNNETPDGRPYVLDKLPSNLEGEPAAWIGCLGCYNAGRLVGRWFFAFEIADETATIPTTCDRCGSDEFDVFDTENLPGRMTVREFTEQAETIHELYTDDPDRYLRLLSLISDGIAATLADADRWDDNNYRGQYETGGDFAYELAVDTGALNECARWITDAIDWQQVYEHSVRHDFHESDGHYWHNA
jgi:hypothetical protein